MENLSSSGVYVSVCVSVRVTPLCARAAHSAVIDLLNGLGVWGQLQGTLSNKYQVSDIKYWNWQGNVASEDPGSQFPFVQLGWLFFLENVVIFIESHRSIAAPRRFGLSGSRFLQRVSLRFPLRWWMVERAVAVLGDWLRRSCQKIKVHFW